MLLQIITVLFGIAFIFSGIAGFLPMFTTDGLLLGLFEVDNMHNLVHIVTGVIAIMAATSFNYAKIYFQVFGTAYFIVGILGLWNNGNLFIMHVNLADNILHIVIGIVAIFIGFSVARNKA